MLLAKPSQQSSTDFLPLIGSLSATPPQLARVLLSKSNSMPSYLLPAPWPGPEPGPLGLYYATTW